MNNVQTELRTLFDRMDPAMQSQFIHNMLMNRRAGQESINDRFQESCLLSEVEGYEFVDQPCPTHHVANDSRLISARGEVLDSVDLVSNSESSSYPFMRDSHHMHLLTGFFRGGGSLFVRCRTSDERTEAINAGS